MSDFFATAIQIAVAWTILSILFCLALGRVFAINPADEDELLLTENDMLDERVISILQNAGN